MSDEPRMRCGNNPRTQLAPGDRAAIDGFAQYLAERKKTQQYLALLTECVDWIDEGDLRDRITTAINQTEPTP